MKLTLKLDLYFGPHPDLVEATLQGAVAAFSESTSYAGGSLTTTEYNRPDGSYWRHSRWARGPIRVHRLRRLR